MVGTGTGRDGNGKPRGFVLDRDCPTLPVVGFVFLHHKMTMDATILCCFGRNSSKEFSIIPGIGIILSFFFNSSPANCEKEDLFI